jgi:hypothetical protein
MANPIGVSSSATARMRHDSARGNRRRDRTYGDLWGPHHRARPAVDLRSRSRHESKPRPIILPLAQVREPPVGLEPTPALRRLYALRAFTVGHERPGGLWGLVAEARGGAKGFSLTLNSP